MLRYFEKNTLDLPDTIDKILHRNYEIGLLLPNTYCCFVKLAKQ